MWAVVILETRPFQKGLTLTCDMEMKSSASSVTILSNICRTHLTMSKKLFERFRVANGKREGRVWGRVHPGRQSLRSFAPGCYHATPTGTPACHAGRRAMPMESWCTSRPRLSVIAFMVWLSVCSHLMNQSVYPAASEDVLAALPLRATREIKM